VLPLLIFAEVKDGVRQIFPAGVAVPLGNSEKVIWVTVQADPDNTGNVYVGDSTVSSTRGVELAPGDSMTFQAIDKEKRYNLAEIYVDAATNNDSVRFVYMVR
jgi:hypothetical protein